VHHYNRCDGNSAASIIDQKADYILALKGNQGNLHKAVKQWFEQARTQQFEGIEHSYYETRESAHDRLEIRQYWTVPADVLGGTFQSEWMGLQSLGMVVSERLWNKTTYEVRYYISSLTSDAKVFAPVRSHWGIENSLHWVLDVTFAEDASRIVKTMPAELFLVAAFGRESASAREDGEGISDEKVPAGLDNNYLAKVVAS